MTIAEECHDCRGGDDASAQIIESSLPPPVAGRQVQIALAHRVIVSSSNTKFVSPDIPGTHEIIRYGMRASSARKFLRKQLRMHARRYDGLTA